MSESSVFLPVRQLAELRPRAHGLAGRARGDLPRAARDARPALQRRRDGDARARDGARRGGPSGRSPPAAIAGRSTAFPYGAKDLLATSGGIPTTWGAAPFREQRFDYDATVIRKLEEAGAVLCAKLAMVELAGGMGYRQPNASFTGPGINPWNADAWSGGSSSGSGSAVAAGLVPFAIGSETWGSILSPGRLLRHHRAPADATGA